MGKTSFDHESLLDGELEESCFEEEQVDRSDAPRSARRRRKAVVAALCFAGAGAAAAAVAGYSGYVAQAPVLSRAPGMGAQSAAQQLPCAEDDASEGSPCDPMTKQDEADLESILHKIGDSSCAAVGENCADSRCCKDAGLQCFRKDSAWAECRDSCIPGPDPVAADGGKWSCDKVGGRTNGKAPVCSQAGENCSESRCCAETGMQCFEKSPGWATCKASCAPGMDLTDSDSTPWTCKALGEATAAAAPWVPKQCAAPGQGCLDKECCSVPGQQCFEKNAYWGECKEACAAPWSCKTRGQRTPEPPAPPQQSQAPLAPWVKEECSATGDDCSSTKCCSTAGNQCFRKNGTHAVCRGSCTPGVDLYDSDSSEWWCRPLGPVTPGVDMSEPWRQGQKVSAWVDDVCAAKGSESCLKSKCCKEPGTQCYEKNEGWAACMMGCTPGPMAGDEDGNWSCNALGPRTHSAWEKPTLYCFSVVQPSNYEPGLLRAQQGSGAGIFACDEYSVFSTTKFSLGFGPNGPVETVTFVPAPVVQSKDHTAGNTELFMHVWDAVNNLGLWQATDWTIKVDPDAVLLPERLRWHLKPHTGKNVYVVNCAKPYMPEGPMMFGAMEAFAHDAIGTYFAKAGDCAGGLPWKEWGEDLFMGKCLEKLGVKRANDWHIYSDGVCTGVDCTDPDAAAFHPKKDVASWMACLEQTKNPVPRSTTDAPQWFKDYMKTYAS